MNKISSYPRQRKLLVNPRAQLGLLVYTAFFALFFHLGLTMVIAIYETAGVSLPSLIMMGVVVTCMVAGLGFLLLFSNRVFGPVYRLQKSLEELAAGGPPRKLNFRKGDHFEDLAEAYNKVIGQFDAQSAEPVKKVVGGDR